MNIEVKLPQLVELNDKIEGLHYAIQKLDKKIDALAVAVSGPVQMDLPLREKPAETAAPAPAKATRGGRRKAQPAATVNNGNGATDAQDAGAEQDDEGTLRARAAFESKRVQRMFGVGAMRAVIKKVAGANVLNVDDVPCWQLMQLLTEMQAL